MGKKLKVIVYDNTSISGKAVARFNKGKNRIKPDTKFTTSKPTVIVNWGSGIALPSNLVRDNIEILNHPDAINKASNKISCLRILEAADVPSLEFATTRTGAEAFFTESSETKVYCRKQIRSHSGRGIVIAGSSSELVEAQLYTNRFLNDIEYRVHVFAGEVIDIQQKKKMSSERLAEKGITSTNTDVRNLMHGWSFTRTDIRLKHEDGSFLTDLIAIPLQATEALGLTFAAIDLAYNSATQELVVIEVNTAAGQKVKTTTNFNYVNAIQKYIGEPITLADYNRRWSCELAPHTSLYPQLLTAFNAQNNE